MTRVTIVSPWRDGMRVMLRYFDQIKALDWPHDDLRMVLVEGDSTDGTEAALRWWVAADPRARLVKCDTGKPRYGSVVHPERFAILATVFNAGLDAVDYEWTDYVLFLPCDITYQPDLLRRLVAHNAAVVAPLVFQNGVFYDIWAFSKDGKNFGPFPRQFVDDLDQTLTECDTMGGTMLIDADVLRAGVRYTTDEVDRGFTAKAKAMGYTLFADIKTHVEHGA